MRGFLTGLTFLAVLLTVQVSPATAQQGPKFDITKVADNVYSFRFIIHRNMIVITKDGVIISDPLNPICGQDDDGRNQETDR